MTDLLDLVVQKLENLRPKLLDLSRRNPLLAARLGGRSSSHVRVIDELPQVLFDRLCAGAPLRIVPLPDIDSDPRDEDTPRFRDALSNARLTDQAYADALDKVDRDADDYGDVVRKIERDLKDRVRADLGLPERQKGSEINITQHARNNHIRPSYELPEHTRVKYVRNILTVTFKPSCCRRISSAG